MKPRRVVKASDNWHGSQRVSSTKLGTDRALNKYKKKKPFVKTASSAAVLSGLSAQTMLATVNRNRLTRHSREDWVK
jgi:hypothetical protein